MKLFQPLVRSKKLEHLAPAQHTAGDLLGVAGHKNALVGDVRRVDRGAVGQHPGVDQLIQHADGQRRDVLGAQVVQNPQDFFTNAYRVLKKNGRLILRDYTTKSKVLLWLCNHIEMPLAHLCGHGDVRLYSGAEFKKFAETAGFEVVSFEAQAKMRAHLVARKN